MLQLAKLGESSLFLVSLVKNIERYMPVCIEVRSVQANRCMPFI